MGSIVAITPVLDTVIAGNPAIPPKDAKVPLLPSQYNMVCKRPKGYDGAFNSYNPALGKVTLPLVPVDQVEGADINVPAYFGRYDVPKRVAINGFVVSAD